MSWQRVAMSGQYNIHKHFPRRGHSVGVLGTSWEDLGADLIHTVRLFPLSLAFCTCTGKAEWGLPGRAVGRIRWGDVYHSGT